MKTSDGDDVCALAWSATNIKTTGKGARRARPTNRLIPECTADPTPSEIIPERGRGTCDGVRYVTAAAGARRLAVGGDFLTRSQLSELGDFVD